MNTQPDHEQHTTKHTDLSRRANWRPGHLRRAAAIAGAAAAVALLAAACGGGSAPAASTAVAQGGNTTTSNADEMPYTDCMRAHGVPDFPDPNAQGKPFTAQNLGQARVPNSPQFQAATTACAHLLVPPSPAQLAQQTSEMVRYAACMRANGVPDFPDPSISANGGPSLDFTQGITDAPDFQSAQRACHSVDPGLPTALNLGKTKAGTR